MEGVKAWHRWCGSLVLMLLCACGGSGGGGSWGDEPPPTPLAIALQGESMIKLRSEGAAWAALVETARSPEDLTRPQRRLLLSPDGLTAQPPAFAPPPGWSLLDFALHAGAPELSVLLASDHELRLLRLAWRAGQWQTLQQLDFADAQLGSDPFYGDLGNAADPAALLPAHTRDAARLAAIGQHLALALRSGRHAVLLYRLDWSAATGFVQRWRRLVEPGVEIYARLLLGGSFDPFKSLDQQWRVALDADAQGRIAVALSLDNTALLDGHRQHFGELAGAPVGGGVLLSQFGADGQRLGTSLVDTQQRSELHALRFVGTRIAVAGRVRSVQTAEGWDAFLALLPAGALQPLNYRVLDFEQGDVLFDLAMLADGRLLLAGATAYTQNPTGASISEQASPLLAVLAADASGAAQRLSMAAGPRHNQLRALAPWGSKGAWLLGGMENGPGTHSADGNPALLTSDGYLRSRELP